MLRAYSKAFSKKDDVVLICKVINNDPSVDINREIAKLNLPDNGPDILFLYNQKIADYQMATLYTSADCFVLPTRGEGWGMPILEAMACGLPTIATQGLPLATANWIPFSLSFRIVSKSRGDRRYKLCGRFGCDCFHFFPA